MLLSGEFNKAMSALVMPYCSSITSSVTFRRRIYRLLFVDSFCFISVCNVPCVVGVFFFFCYLLFCVTVSCLSHVAFVVGCFVEKNMFKR